MRGDGTRYNTSFMSRIADDMGSTLLFMAENWRIFVAIAGAIGWWVNRETEDEKKRKPELVDQIVANATVRCEQQTKFPQLSPYESRLREAVKEPRSAAFDRIMNHKVTICLDQKLPEFKPGWLGKSFYGAYYYNGGDPVLTLWDKGKARKDAGFLETKIDKYSEEAINKFAHDFLTSHNQMPADMLAYEDSRRYKCGDSTCTEHFIRWIPAEKYAAELNKAGLDKPPIKSDAPAVAYKIW